MVFSARCLLLVLLVLIGVVHFGVADAAAQNGTDFVIETGSDELNERPERCDRHIDAETSICSVEYDNGVLELELYADSRMPVTLSDMSTFFESGEVRQQSFVLRDNATSTIIWSLREHNGNAGVSIQTRHVLWSEPVTEDTVLIGEPWSADDVQIGTLVAAASVSAVSIVKVLTVVTGRVQKPEKLV